MKDLHFLFGRRDAPPSRLPVALLRLPTVVAAVFVLALATPGVALADDTEDDAVWEESDKLPAVQNRLYRMEHEFNASVGVLPIDTYYKGVALGGGYAWHWTDLWAFEAHFYYMQNMNTSLRDKLENNFGIKPKRFAEIKFFGELGALFKPLYGKLSFLNKTLVYGEFYVSLTGIVARMEGGKKTEDHTDGKPPRMAFGGAPGFGLRGYFHKYMSVRFDFRQMIIYSMGEGHYPLSLTLSFAFTTRSDL
jgi:outer membrane beta-barrel protein